MGKARGKKGAKRMGARYLLVLLLIITTVSGALGSGCGDCEMHWANLTNIGFVNAAAGAGSPMSPQGAYGSLNLSYCGCADLNNTVVANATDQFGRVLGPEVVYQKINLTYFAGLDITKIPELVTNMTEVGPDLVLVEYNITVTNIGQVNVTGIYVYDPRLGDYSLGKLLPGENVTIDPNPYYIITPDDVAYCSINNVAMVTGKDRCCRDVGPAVAYANVPLATKNLETYLKIYARELIEHGYDLKTKGGDAEDLEDFEEMIRIQANRLMVMEDAIKANVTHCRLPPPVNLARAGSTDALGNPTCPQAGHQIVSPQVYR